MLCFFALFALIVDVVLVLCHLSGDLIDSIEMYLYRSLKLTEEEIANSEFKAEKVLLSKCPYCTNNILPIQHPTKEVLTPQKYTVLDHTCLNFKKWKTNKQHFYISQKKTGLPRSRWRDIH